MKITKKQTMLISGLFGLLFPIPWIFFADRILDNYFPSTFGWYILPLIIVLSIWGVLYRIDTFNTPKEKIINIAISMTCAIIVGLLTGVAFMMYALSNTPMGGV